MPVPCIALMLKAPMPGRVKTRLAAELAGGVEEAAQIYRQLVEHQWRQLPVGWRREIHFAPPEAEAVMRDWLPKADGYYPQPNGDLGTRLLAAADGAMSRGASTVYLIGGDCPGLRTHHFLEAQEALDKGYDFAIGPASDGGYTLLAIKRPAPELFSDIPWSTPEVFPLTMLQTQQLGWRGYVLETLEDVDDGESWRRQKSCLTQ